MRIDLLKGKTTQVPSSKRQPLKTLQLIQIPQELLGYGHSHHQLLETHAYIRKSSSVESSSPGFHYFPYFRPALIASIQITMVLLTDNLNNLDNKATVCTNIQIYSVHHSHNWGKTHRTPWIRFSLLSTITLQKSATYLSKYNLFRNYGPSPANSYYLPCF